MADKIYKTVKHVCSGGGNGIVAEAVLAAPPARC